MLYADQENKFQSGRLNETLLQAVFQNQTEVV